MFKSITLEVVGSDRLNCEGCEERVENALKKVPGVGKIRAHSSNQRIEVLFDAAKLDADAIAERITNAGYQTRVVPA
jgi:copper chaperone